MSYLDILVKKNAIRPDRLKTIKKKLYLLDGSASGGQAPNKFEGGTQEYWLTKIEFMGAVLDEAGGPC